MVVCCGVVSSMLECAFHSARALLRRGRAFLLFAREERTTAINLHPRLLGFRLSHLWYMHCALWSAFLQYDRACEACVNKRFLYPHALPFNLTPAAFHSACGHPKEKNEKFCGGACTTTFNSQVCRRRIFSSMTVSQMKSFICS